jgi:hypothetical protein
LIELGYAAVYEGLALLVHERKTGSRDVDAAMVGLDLINNRQGIIGQTDRSLQK